MTNSIVKGNTSSTWYEAGIGNPSGSRLTISNSEVSGNESKASPGGGIFLDYYSEVHLTNVSMLNNTADYGGGCRGWQYAYHDGRHGMGRGRHRHELCGIAGDRCLPEQ
jgi:hypothetical protein